MGKAELTQLTVLLCFPKFFVSEENPRTDSLRNNFLLNIPKYAVPSYYDSRFLRNMTEGNFGIKCDRQTY